MSCQCGDSGCDLRNPPAPSAELTIPDGAHLIRCAECAATMAYGGTATLEHAEDGSHVFSPTYG